MLGFRIFIKPSSDNLIHATQLVLQHSGTLGGYVFSPPLPIFVKLRKFTGKDCGFEQRGKLISEILLPLHPNPFYLTSPSPNPQPLYLLNHVVERFIFLSLSSLIHFSRYTTSEGNYAFFFLTYFTQHAF